MRNSGECRSYFIGVLTPEEGNRRREVYPAGRPSTTPFKRGWTDFMEIVPKSE